MNFEDFLRCTEIIDFDDEAVAAKAKELGGGCDGDVEIAKRCFEFVRDEIRHTNDYKDDVTTCKASEVLAHGTGWCYAKSHLLAALLRANGIPTALCYQRLSVFDDGAPYCLHGLNAVYLKDYGWYRVDARGNKEGVNAQFRPPHEQLAFGLNFEGEKDIDGLFADPMPVVTEALRKYDTREEVLNNLPDFAG
jgi:transglutaminase-like putative cysteine protease